MHTKDKIIAICEDIKDLLVAKNERYGDSALTPVRIFSQADNKEQLRVRIDDKLSRIHTAHLDEDEEVLQDLVGYLILYMISLKDDEPEVLPVQFNDIAGTKILIGDKWLKRI